MIYGVVCFGILFSFVGTVLGGIWADQSWGRFWGWDPKENGAVLIVLWNALVLHARWAGLVRERGLAALAIGGNIITSWSWFGTNMLGVGLHSYGFMDSALLWLLMFVGTQLALIAVANIPIQHWRSRILDDSAPPTRSRFATGSVGSASPDNTAHKTTVAPLGHSTTGAAVASLHAKEPIDDNKLITIIVALGILATLAAMLIPIVKKIRTQTNQLTPRTSIVVPR
jgi:hypothetical protein